MAKLSPLGVRTLLSCRGLSLGTLLLVDGRVVVSTVFVAFDVVGLIPASGAKLADDVASWQVNAGAPSC